MAYNPDNTHIPKGTALSDAIITELVPVTYPVVEKYAMLKLASMLHNHAKSYTGEAPRDIADFGTAERFYMDVTGGVSDMHDRAVSFLMYQNSINKSKSNPDISYSGNPCAMFTEYERILNVLMDLPRNELADASIELKDMIIHRSDFFIRGLESRLSQEFDKSVGWYVWSNYQSLARNSEFVSSTGLGDFEIFQ